jgi:hypothetical protein
MVIQCTLYAFLCLQQKLQNSSCTTQKYKIFSFDPNKNKVITSVNEEWQHISSLLKLDMHCNAEWCAGDGCLIKYIEIGWHSSSNVTTTCWQSVQVAANWPYYLQIPCTFCGGKPQKVTLKGQEMVAMVSYCWDWNFKHINKNFFARYLKCRTQRRNQHVNFQMKQYHTELTRQTLCINTAFNVNSILICLFLILLVRKSNWLQWHTAPFLFSKTFSL